MRHAPGKVWKPALLAACILGIIILSERQTEGNMPVWGFRLLGPNRCEGGGREDVTLHSTQSALVKHGTNC